MSNKHPYFHIPHVHYDIIARVIPGLLFLALIWWLLLEKPVTDNVYNGLKEMWPLWIGLVLIAYSIGQIVDGFSWILTNHMAELAYGLLNKSKPEKWDDVLNKYLGSSEARKHIEATFCEKAQVESRFFVNLSILVLLLLVLLLIKAVVGSLESYVGSFISKDSSEIMIVVGLIALVPILVLAAYYRQRRRVKGILAIQDSLFQR
ncbi:MAG: hypothetical protein KAV00_08360 [Phycisphaerae bacterium]|nr:hypothetical protein [Phycisphaerae bacterium]